jgi:hypothetical protein
MANGLESIADPLLGPLLALLKDAINSDLAAEQTAAGVVADEVEDAVTAVYPNAVNLQMLGQATLPALSAFRLRTRSTRVTSVYWEHTYTLQFEYITPQTALEQIDNRWPLLDRVWLALIDTLCRGTHADHEGGDEVLADAGIVKVLTGTAQKQEAYVEGTGYAYPMFRASIDIVCQSNRSRTDIDDLGTANTVRGKFFIDPDVDDYATEWTPDVVADADLTE